MNTIPDGLIKIPQHIIYEPVLTFKRREEIFQFSEYYASAVIHTEKSKISAAGQ